MRQRNKILTLLITLVMFSMPAAWANDASKAELIELLMSQYHELQQFNGAVLVAKDGEILFQSGYGLANMESSTPNTPETKFRIGSVTKQFTAMLILQQVEEGTLSLDDTLSEMLPYYREDTGSQITLHQLLNHTSGIPSYTGMPGFRGKTNRLSYDPETFVQMYCSDDLTFEPGSEFRYNNSGYFLLGAILEHATGKAYADLLQERILDPVKMNNTGYDVSEEILPHRAAGYSKTLQGFKNAEYIDMSVPYAAGSMYSTVGDLYLWDRALRDGKLLGESLSKAMFTPGMGDYGYGWGVASKPIGPDNAERQVTLHGGGINGFSAWIERVAGDEHLIVLLNNIDASPAPSISAHILDILYGRELDEPSQSPSELIAITAVTSGIEAAVTTYRKLAKSEPSAVENVDAQINRYGYIEMRDGNLESALTLFRLNAELFPESGNVYDSLGEALAESGQIEDAIKSYTRSLELDPSNKNAEEYISKLRSLHD